MVTQHAGQTNTTLFYFAIFFLFFGGTRDLIQGLVLVRQALYHLSQPFLLWAFLFLFLLFAVLALELRASHLLGRCFTT
jgi:hypothetical protein